MVVEMGGDNQNWEGVEWIVRASPIKMISTGRSESVEDISPTKVMFPCLKDSKLSIDKSHFLNKLLHLKAFDIIRFIYSLENLLIFGESQNS